ncbi:hypothetical protein ACQPU1_06225 [Clostridium paraputrificum]|uniref:hypothetical protein n=1 Tax=Clostridium TaxID=1485 RepID=UPI003D355129
MVAVKDYREMYTSAILTHGKEIGLEEEKLNRSYLAKLTFEELKELAQKLQG